ncbi:3-oxoacyl-[acyl-carrier-protein] synthase III C-terminal domain-containing protein [Actinophytocola oryzae]|uniref:3-oxoacyl-[acyl-carrier-protein] synthase-3 n=1 Tax=Actinophytocola oryzae TaxID=502181 RepID=A0A4R7VZ36_9PSEU|nr:3-oxoacyl-[acyl-carrier-protein] synthase III C-terminal domain-containing protein [Actinophytocola oryzae]TDV54819.1 3-oxoacyl-[acyl-carrier-protein] synthase-3 [Actinophytocola oryzae]
MTIALSRVAVGMPSRCEPVDDILTRGGHTVEMRRMFDRVYKLRQSPTLGEGERMADLLIRTGKQALAGRRASLVLYGHTLQLQPFAHSGGFARRVRDGLGLPGVPFYGVSHVACTSVLRSVQLGSLFLRRQGGAADECVLVLGGDQGSVSEVTRIVPGMTVGGDAAVGFRVERAEQGGRYRVRSTATGRDTRFHRSLRMSADELRLFGAVCADQLMETVDRALAGAGLTRADVDWVMPHLSNAMFWKTVSAKSGIGIEKFRTELLPTQGHNFGTDALMALDHADRAGDLLPGQRCVLISLGQGAYYQVVVIEIAEES